MRLIQSAFPLLRRFAIGAALACALDAARAADAVEFSNDIRPLLEKRCFECHGEKKQKGGLRLDRKADILRGGDSNHAPFVAGKSGESEMFKRATSDDPDEMMPPKGERLTAEQVGKLQAWIDAGAAIPDDGSMNVAKHWAYVKPEARPLPEPQKVAWCRNGLDRWILARLEKEGLKPSPEAERAVLLRRVSLDLTGLPPTLAEVDAFIADTSLEAYEKCVDRLLASPAYGERWARPWLDLARYADTQGFEKDARRTMWPYRDWVINAFNRDLPFDQFTIEQIAGDLLPNATQEQKVATGFHRNTMTNTEGGTDNEEFRYEALVDRVNTTFGVWMGTTLQCAQCHNHKYDPFLTKEYYQSMAFLNNTADADNDDESPTMKVFVPGQQEQLDQLRAAQKAAEQQFAEIERTPEFVKAQAEWEQAVAPTLTPWTTLVPLEFKSLGGATLTKTASNSIEASGTNPDVDTYVVTTSVPAGTRIGGVRLEVLETGAEKATGRHANGGFVLRAFEMDVSVTGLGAPLPIKFQSVTADHSEPGLDVGNLLTGAGTGWAIGPYDKPENKVRRSAYFVPESPLNLPQGGQLVFSLKHSPQHPAANIRRFRLSITDREGAGAQWVKLDPLDAKSDGGVVLAKAGDAALLATGENPAKATYTVTAQTRLKGITGFRVEALADDALPGKGPGRSPGGNFILTEFRAMANGQPVKFASATADHSQADGWPVSNAIDGNPETGWAIAPQMGQPHHADFAIAQPLNGGDALALTFSLEGTNSQWPQYVLGKFRISATTAPLDIAPVPPDVAAILAIPAAQRAEAQLKRIVAHFKSISLLVKPLADAAGAAKKAADDFFNAVPISSVMVELPQPRVTKRHVRGAYLSTAEEVQPVTPAVLHPFPKDTPPNRLGFAKWIVDRENPLTARVIVNRFWEQYFGKGIVETVEEFGKQGELPSHPELLDWLAIQFMDGSGSGQPWSMKALHKLIVTSATYRQTSRVTPELRERDPFNRLFARGPRVRLEAEMIRDEALAVAGLLSPKIGGASVFPPQPAGLWQIVYNGEDWKTSPGEDKYRRGLYTFWRRSMPHPMMTTFDAPSREFCVLRRNRSDTPLQALNTLNDPAFVEAAQALARKTAAQPGDTRSRATFAFRACLSRPPTEAEVARLTKLYESEYAGYINKPADAEKMATSELGKPAGEANVTELAAWTVVANVLLNLDEMISKG
jgi:hypothetical protein